MPSHTFFSGTADNRIQADGSTYAIARAGTSTLTAGTVTDTNRATAGQQEFFGYRWWSFFFAFDTSAIDDTDTVDSATVSIYFHTDSSSTDFTIEIREKDWGASVTTADFVAGASLSGLTLLASKTTSGLSTAAYTDFTSEAAITSWVNKTGTSYALMCSSHTTNNTAPGVGATVSVDGYTADDSGTTRDPKLVVNTTAAGGAEIPFLVMSPPVPA